MKNIYKFILILLLFATNIIISQNVYVCEKYTENGIPLNTVNKMEIKSYGKSANILIDNKNSFNSNILYLFIDKLVDGKYIPFDSKIWKIDKNQTWAAREYVFIEAGNYEIYFLNSNEKKLASVKLEVISEIESIMSKDLGNSQFVLCEMIVNDRPMNPISQLSLSNQGNDIYAFINNYSAFNSDRILVKTIRRSENSDEYKELISTKKFKVTPRWSITFFKLSFSEPGDYKIDVYEKDNKLIVSKIFTVIN